MDAKTFWTDAFGNRRKFGLIGMLQSIAKDSAALIRIMGLMRFLAFLGLVLLVSANDHRLHTPFTALFQYPPLFSQRISATIRIF